MNPLLSLFWAPTKVIYVWSCWMSCWMSSWMSCWMSHVSSLQRFGQEIPDLGQETHVEEHVRSWKLKFPHLQSTSPEYRRHLPASGIPKISRLLITPSTCTKTYKNSIFGPHMQLKTNKAIASYFFLFWGKYILIVLPWLLSCFGAKSQLS